MNSFKKLLFCKLFGHVFPEDAFEILEQPHRISEQIIRCARCDCFVMATDFPLLTGFKKDV